MNVNHSRELFSLCASRSGPRYLSRMPIIRVFENSHSRISVARCCAVPHFFGHAFLRCVWCTRAVHFHSAVNVIEPVPTNETSLQSFNAPTGSCIREDIRKWKEILDSFWMFFFVGMQIKTFTVQIFSNNGIVCYHIKYSTRDTLQKKSRIITNN